MKEIGALRRSLKLVIAVIILINSTYCRTTTFAGNSRRAAAKPPVVTRTFTQAPRPELEAKFIQGHDGVLVAENFDQGEWGKLDLLVVVDDSPSMEEEQANLSTKLAPLLSSVSQSDWQIGVTTTDPSEPCLRGLIKKSDPDTNGAFLNAVRAGDQGIGYERGILRARAGLECGSWIRSDSTLAVLIVSDEDNCSNGNDEVCQGRPDINQNYLLDYMSSIRKLGQDARVYGLIWHPSLDHSQCPTGYNPANIYASVISSTSGKWGSICDTDYTNTLKAISDDVAKILKMEYTLKQAPDPGSLEVLVNGAPWTDYVLSGTKITFKTPPPFGSKVEFKYKVGKQGEITNELQLGKDPSEGSLKVIIDGVELPQDGYTFDAGSKNVVLNSAPAENSNIVIKYKENSALPQEFDIGKTADPGTIKVKVNNKETKEFQYDEDSGKIKISSAPPEQAEIIVEFVEKKTS